LRRIAFIFALLIGIPGVLLASSAGADDSHTYRIEFDNAFGLVHDSQVRVAGVTEGTVQSLDVDAAKRAVVTVKLSGPVSQLRVDATCSSEPQSLIAEYFVDCQPGKSKKVLPDNGLVPVSQTRTTVQNDLVQATLREPYKERLSLLINEFGTALAGNPNNLNAAIRRGAPALQALRKALAILAGQNHIIANLNVNSDQIISRLAARRQDVVRFVQNANRTAVASSQRKSDLSRNFALLPGFLAQLRPTLARLGDLSQASTPVLTQLNESAGQLNRLTTTLPRFNDASTPAIQSLGGAADIGRQALTEGRDEIEALNQASVHSFDASNPIANLLVDIDDPSRTVENDARAPGVTGRPAPSGYTGMEGLLNYAYYQTLAVNQFDNVGHLLHFILEEFQVGPCGQFNASSTVPSSTDTAGPGQPGYVGTTNPANRNRCVSWVGPNQPGINAGPSLPPYPGSVCPTGSTDLSICNPANARQTAAAQTRQSPAAGAGGPALQGPSAPAQPGAGGGNSTPQLPNAPNLPNLPNLPNGPKLPHVPKNPNLPNLPNVPNVPGLGGLGGLLGIGQNGSQSSGGGVAGTGVNVPSLRANDTTDLLDFLYGN
jgi:ABC-type transporter Mla subunit MlaD